MAKLRFGLLLAAVESCQQFWQLLQAVSTALTTTTAVDSFDTWYKLSTALTAVTSCQQL